jgi:hypothetical protein
MMTLKTILYHFWYRHKDPIDFHTRDYYYDNFISNDYWSDRICSSPESKFLRELQKNFLKQNMLH